MFLMLEGDFGRFISYISGYFGIKNVWDIFLLLLDIGIIAYIVYKLIFLLRDSRALQLIKGLILILIVSLIANLLELDTLSYVIRLLIDVLPLLLVVTFQPELRRAIEGVGKGRFRELFATSPTYNAADMSVMIEEVVKAVKDLSKAKMGALIVFERETNLGEIIRSGTVVDSAVSAQFLKVIFTPPLPLHDGAVIIRGTRIHAAACLLPTTTDLTLNKDLGTRHRAGIGITETADCVSVIVSEETGVISVAKDGVLTRNFNSDTLRKLLKDNLMHDDNKKAPKKWSPAKFKAMFHNNKKDGDS